jgi:hypothetical protein
MDKERRDNLRTVIGRGRRLVEESLRAQLVAYGLFTDSPPLARGELALRPEQEPHYNRVLDAVRREARAVGKPNELVPEAVVRLVREAGGTWVNRLAALRAMEVRGLLEPPAAFVSEEYGGLSPSAMRLREVAAERSTPLLPDEALRRGIEDACRQLSESVRVLFDLSDEQSLLRPDGVALREVLRLFSNEVTTEDWSQPDVLGWVYQYYNTEANADLKRRKNRTTGFKYRPDDIPVANQFYTPHWVVRVLTDNTLGRLWLEMQDRLPQLDRTEEVRDGKSVVGYRLVERRREVPHAATEADDFKAWIAEEADPLRDRTVDRLCRFLVPLPSVPLPRGRKSPRDIKVLDPACGSGHFLLYAFDVLFAMYREAEPDLDARDIPALILERNLFGIDIDLRAAQLAAFNLYLKARTTLASIDPSAQLPLRGLNIVVADAHIGDDSRKDAFLDRYRADPEIQALYRKVLSDLDHTNALGSLIKVRAEFETLFGRIREAKQRKPQPPADAWPTPRQGVLIDTSPQLELRSAYRSTSGRTWTISELLDELRAFEAEAAPTQDVGARMFYTDLERTVGLLGLLSEQYDVVLMNPPYGDMPPETKDYLQGNKRKGIPPHYPRTHGDLFAAFIEQALDLTVENGFLGGLVPWTYMFVSTLSEVRTEILCGEARPELLQEYGYGVPEEATVGTVATVARKLPPAAAASVPQHLCVFDRVSDRKRDVEKYAKFLETCPRFVASGPGSELDWFIARLSSFQDVPRMPYAYWASDSLRALFKKFAPLDRDQTGVVVPGRPTDKVADVRQGLATADDARFVRYWWEVPPNLVGQGRRWAPFVKGGPNVGFYTRVDLLVNWEGDGREQREFGRGRYQARDFYFRPGITWPRVSWRIRKFGLFGDGHIFADKGCSLFPVDGRAEPLLGVLNSAVGAAMMLIQTPERMWEVGMVGGVPICKACLSAPTLPGLVGRLVSLRSKAHEGDETCRDFTGPDLLQILRRSRPGDAGPPLDLAVLLVASASERRRLAEEEADAILTLDAEVFKSYMISAEDQALIEAELVRRAAEGSDYPVEEGGQTGAEETEPQLDERGHEEGEEGGSDEVEAAEESPVEATPGPTRDLVVRWISSYLKERIEADEDGIVVLDAIHGEPPLEFRVREAMERDVGKDSGQALALQAPKYLGTQDLGEWLATSREETIENGGEKQRLPVGFFPWHVALYRNRPIFWLVSSENFDQGKSRLTFRAFLHYHKLTADTLPRLLSYYLAPVIGLAEREWKLARDEAARLAGKARTAANAKADEWLATVGALKRFRSAVEAVIQGPLQAEKVPGGAKWLRRTIAQVRGGQDVGHGYRPDIDFGVRVNITPLVEQRLLPKVVLKRLGG